LKLLITSKTLVIMKNAQFTPLTQQEMVAINGGGLLDGLLGTVTNLVGGLPIVGGLLSGVLTTVTNLVTSLLGGLNLPV
jgi:hypothetical protein